MATDTTTNPILTPRTPQELQDLATSQVGGEIDAKEAPLRTQVSDLQGRETSTLQKIGDMFGTLQPYVSGAAQNVANSYDQAFTAAQGIFNAATQHLNEFKQSRAQEAQALAQKIGGPVSVGEFTAGVLPQMEQLAMTAPNSLLHMLGNAQAGVQEANAFSGRVFPLVRTEAEANARNTFESNIKDLNSQIDALEGSKQGEINGRVNDLLTSERQFQLNQNQLGLDKLKAGRDWQATLRSLKNDDARLALARKQFGIQEAGVTGTYKGKPTQSAIKLSNQEMQAAARLKISEATLRERIQHNTETESIQRQRVQINQEHNAMAIVDAATGGNHPVTITHRVNLDQSQGATAMALGKTDVHRDSKTGKYYRYEKVSMTPTQLVGAGYELPGNAPITDPQRLYDLLRGAQIPAPMALKVVRAKTGINDFSPGQPVNYDHGTLSGMTTTELRGIAEGRGYKYPRKAPSRGNLIDFITSRNPSTYGMGKH